MLATRAGSQSQRLLANVCAVPARSASGFGNWDFSWVRNEKVKPYAPGSADRAALRKAVDAQYARSDEEIPCIIGGKEIFTGNTGVDIMPTQKDKTMCTYHLAGEAEIKAAIDTAMSPDVKDWATWSFEDRAAVFLKAADLCAGKYREELNASIMLSTGKTARETDIDNTEISDFYRFGVRNAAQIYDMQPPSLYEAQEYWNRSEYRPLEGFVYAVAPFNFCALGANLAGIPVRVGPPASPRSASASASASLTGLSTVLLPALPSYAGSDGQHCAVQAIAHRGARVLLRHEDLEGSWPPGRRHQLHPGRWTVGELHRPAAQGPCGCELHR
jgi:1-pyrroline-5-carboxylate dehydrogenase